MSHITGVVLFVVLVATPVAVYVMGRGHNAKAPSRIAFALLAAVLTLIAFVGTFGYAIYGLEDFHDQRVSFATALIGNLVIWAICLGAWFFAVRFFLLACRKAR
ncbi:MAG TPA: hypothetical protein VG498_01690 [Terriglobales bacterium]|nr:hypothetical protein [Terriglobales bacterium]